MPKYARYTKNGRVPVTLYMSEQQYLLLRDMREKSGCSMQYLLSTALDRVLAGLAKEEAHLMPPDLPKNPAALANPLRGKAR